MTSLAPFLTMSIEHLDFNDQDAQDEIIRMMERNCAIAALLDGSMHPDDLLDLLEAQGLDPVQYVNEVDSNVDWIIRNLCPGRVLDL
ncbi:hypothetical protein HNI00_07265 [Thermoleptolyngbya oregonensis NK1-22]|uniref:Uncharacterized protein n=1 Tax=Thermoleptolyngbya oregonensis NK1-22 TaxID=2547457 RepID=A0AA96Y3B8_9CYAN|nr:hypothetical protein [Thermoleptolyngbya oregonensis]WOB42975.1 hypothetical protein HNI00_07265 [Thermoleptolyngbya oregonensis NK1-22]